MENKVEKKKCVIITQRIIDYINEHKAFFENDTPNIGDKWYIEKEATYPNVNDGKPVVELSKDNGEWMRLPKSIVDDLEYAAQDYAFVKTANSDTMYGYVDFVREEAFKAGANWYKEQMVKDGTYNAGFAKGYLIGSDDKEEEMMRNAFDAEVEAAGLFHPLFSIKNYKGILPYLKIGDTLKMILVVKDETEV